MNADVIRQALAQSIEVFKSEYPEWTNYNIVLQSDSVSIKINDGDTTLATSAAKELLNDFATVLKQQNLMITSRKPGSVKIGEYTYLSEEGLEELADEIEVKLGKGFSNLVVSERNGKPYVRFNYIGSPTSKDKKIMRDSIEEIVRQYEPIDEDDLFANVEFDDFDEITEKIEEENLEEVLEEDEIKAEDEIEVDYDDAIALADLYEDLYQHLKMRIGNQVGAIQGLDKSMDEAFEEVDKYLCQFGPLDETVDITLAKLTPDEIDGYVEIINKWMKY
jgi:phytoene dehydrogenase-like protein